MTSESQPSDRLRDILRRARDRSADAAAAPPAQARAQAETSVESLLDKNQPLPDPRALARLYQEQTLNNRLPDSFETEAAIASTAAPAAPGWSELPAPTPAPSTQLTMSPAEIRKVMTKLQSEFGGSYKVYEPPKTPEEDFGARAFQAERERELAELKRLADESASSNWVFLLGAAVVAVIVGAFIYLAAVGPLHASPPPPPTPSAKATAAR